MFIMSLAQYGTGVPLYWFPCITKYEFFRNELADVYDNRLLGIQVVSHHFGS